ncbi:hypothetical protein Bca52824_086140 [Brassica carinata]|uniref:Uncharacterized protein n=1 Tax=Brassica carinata TaxID=52824 RepID=A0A8X7TLQ5_BRACI|nr:hypothetical protein Bca52824_086140 [Brassica carinata]
MTNLKSSRSRVWEFSSSSRSRDLVGLQGWFTTCSVSSWTLRRSMRCGLVGPEPLRFSPLEFENLTGSKPRKYIEDLETPKCDATPRWFLSGMLGVHPKLGQLLIDNSKDQEMRIGPGRSQLLSTLHLHRIH